MSKQFGVAKRKNCNLCWVGVFTSRSVFLLGMLAIAGAGCESYSPVKYVAPRITGRVLDSQSQRPITGVEVRRVQSRNGLSLDAPKGGQLLMQGPTEATDDAGNFVLQSKRSLTPFGRTEWFGVTLSFVHPRYRTAVFTYTLLDATNRTDDVPTIEAGDILLEPKRGGAR